MLGKLLKYDLRWSYKNLIIFYALSIILAVITRIMSLIENSIIFMVITKICSGTLIAIFVNIFINNFIRVWARVMRNLYKDESYLTHTLPVSKNNIFMSKILTAIITTITSSLVILASSAIAYYSEENWQLLKTLVESSAIYFDSSVGGFLTIVIVTLFFELLFMLMSGIIGIVIGHRYNNLKTLKSIIFGFILYMIPSALTIGILYVVGLFNPDVMKLFNNSTEFSTEALKLVLFCGIIIYIIYDIIYYFVGKKVLNKGVNVD